MTRDPVGLVFLLAGFTPCPVCAAYFAGPPPRSRRGLLAASSAMALVVGSRLFTGTRASRRGWKGLEATVDAHTWFRVQWKTAPLPSGERPPLPASARMDPETAGDASAGGGSAPAEVSGAGGDRRR
jgi:hypothetical protein